MNDALGNTGVTVTYGPCVTASPADGAASLTDLVADMKTGKVDVLIILGGNPAFTAPADLGFADAIARSRRPCTSVSTTMRPASCANGTCPEAHYLESWGDGRSFEGTVSLMQPLIAPLYDGRQAIRDSRGAQFTTRSAASGPRQGLLDAHVRRQDEDRSSARRRRQTVRRARPRCGGTRCTMGFWRVRQVRQPRRGTTGTASAKSPVAAAIPKPQPELSIPAPVSMTGIEIVFRPDPAILDGRFANNGWLQEFPKPLSKVTWDNVAYIGTKMAGGLNIPASRTGNQGQDVLEIAYGGQVGPDASVGVAGHGRRRGHRAFRPRAHTRRPRRQFGRRELVPASHGQGAVVRRRRHRDAYGRDVRDRIHAESLHDGGPRARARP